MWTTCCHFTIFKIIFLGTQKEKDAYYKPIHSLNLKRLFGSIDSDLQVKPSTTSFAHDILNVVEIDKIRSEVNSLSNEIVLNMISNATLDDNKQGNVYFAEVTVVCEKNGLVVKKKVGIFPFYKIYLDKLLTVYITTETKYLEKSLWILERHREISEWPWSLHRRFKWIAFGAIYHNRILHNTLR